VSESTILIVANSRSQNETGFQDVPLNTFRQLIRYRNSPNGITIVNHRDLILLTSIVRPKTMWGSHLHVRVYPQQSGPAYRLPFLHPLLLCAIVLFGNSLSFSFYLFYTDRKRAPLPPQTTTFLTSSTKRDAPGSENGRPRISPTLAPPHLPGDNYNEMKDLDRSRQELSGMKEERMDRYSRVIILLHIQLRWLFMNLSSLGRSLEVDPLSI
jgi:hypothetical protein